MPDRITQFVLTAVTTTLLAFAPATVIAKGGKHAMTITFRKNPSAGVGPECFAQVTPNANKKLRSDREDNVKWVLRSTTCPDFKADQVTLTFDTDVMASGRTLRPRLIVPDGWVIQDDTTANNANAPDGSVHIYVIRYKTVNAGDPEIDINPGSRVLPTRRGRGNAKK